MKSGLRRPGWGVVLLGALLFSTGCQLGPGRLKVASSHYSDAVRIAAAESLLVNLVRLRYRDAPLFLSVTSISTQFEFNAALGVEGTSSWSPGSDAVGADAGISYSERPTISFSIMGGEEFEKRLLTPLGVASISLLAESGWRGDRVLRLTVENLNWLRNAPRASGPTPDSVPEYKTFTEATRLLAELGREDLIHFDYEMRREPLSAPLSLAQVDGENTVEAVKAGVEFEIQQDGRVQLFFERRTLVMRFARESASSAPAARLRELLRLEPGRSRFDVVELEESDYDPLEPDRHLSELAIDSRSLMGVLYYLSNGVEVSDQELQSGSVTTTTDEDGKPFAWSTLLDGLFEVHSDGARRRPSVASVAVRHRGRWFYIDDTDQSTKSTFLLLGQLFSLQAGDVEEFKPVLTLPVGG
jgi:hypothetical protein